MNQTRLAGEKNMTISGSKVFQETLHARSLRILGHGKFNNGIIAERLTSYGSCYVLGACQVQQMSCHGHSSIQHVQARNIVVSGSFAADGVNTDLFEAKGKVSITGALQASRVIIWQHGRASVEDIYAEQSITIKNDRTSLLSWLSLGGKLGRFGSLRGRKIEVNDVQAEVIAGEHVTIGANCHVDKVIYSQKLTASPRAVIGIVEHRPELETVWRLEL